MVSDITEEMVPIVTDYARDKQLYWADNEILDIDFDINEPLVKIEFKTTCLDRGYDTDTIPFTSLISYVYSHIKNGVKQ